jgi:SAM-dependent methyltransferase
MVSRRQIKQAIEILSNACEEDFIGLKKEIQDSISVAKDLMESTESKITALVKDQGKSQLYGFTSAYVRRLKHKHSDSVKNFIKNWCVKQTDWRYPWCFLCANDLKYVEHAVRSHLVYVCTNIFDDKKIKNYVLNALSKKGESNPNMFRAKPLEFTGHIRDRYVPHNQIGTLISVDFVPYISIEQIKNLMESIRAVLRPGGQALIHFSDGDGEAEWRSVVDHKITYVNEDLFKSFASEQDLSTNFYHIDSFYSFAILTKPGEKTSIKDHLTRIEQIKNTK